MFWNSGQIGGDGTGLRNSCKGLLVFLLLLIFTYCWSGIREAFQINSLALQVVSLQLHSAGTNREENDVFPLATFPRGKAIWAIRAMQNGRIEQAIDVLEDIVLSRERPLLWQLLLVQAYRAAGRVEEARQIVEQLPGVKRAVVARCESSLWHWKGADDPRFWFPILEKMGNLTADEECLLGAYYLVTIGNPEAAEVAISRAVARSDFSAGWFSYFGQIYFYRYHNYARAAHFLRAAIQFDSRVDVKTYWLLANSERQLHNTEAAIEAYRAMEQLIGGGSNHLAWRKEYAAYLRELGHLAEAQTVYRSILQIAPDDSTARDALGK